MKITKEQELEKVTSVLEVIKDSKLKTVLITQLQDDKTGVAVSGVSGKGLFNTAMAVIEVIVSESGMTWEDVLEEIREKLEAKFNPSMGDLFKEILMNYMKKEKSSDELTAESLTELLKGGIKND